LYVGGKNIDGQFGNGDRSFDENDFEIVKIPNNEKIIKIFARNSTNSFIYSGIIKFLFI